MLGDRKNLLRAVRRGDVAALLAVYDLWIEEGADRQVSEYETLLVGIRWSLSEKRATKRRRVSPAENIYRWFRDFVYAINKVERCWRLPSNRWSIRGTPTWEWIRGMSGQLVTVFRERLAAEAALTASAPGPG